MFEELDEHERFMAEIASLKLCLMAFLHHGFGQDMEALQAVANTADISIDDFQWTNTEPDRAAMLSEATRERVTSLMTSVMNAQKVE
ncbi:MAG: hypothetical protein OXT06_01935 [Rhodospirillaceae bacterium]|nr:hypothetical protein [Rhodospirillaceae bacterium]MDD9914095.1 hypothetical protein [Rhodospirillaceae bacterium]MDD9926372.1 hypothetical protein [Rhodospirillaceae bacterium]